MSFGEVLTAMVTPFDARGEVDLEKTKRLVDYLIENGSDGLVVTGTTGESPTLSDQEKAFFYDKVAEYVGGRVPVIAGTGMNDTGATIRLTKEAEKTNVDAIMLVNPYYNKPNQQGLYEHYKTVATQTKLPVILYDVPGRTVVSMTADTVVNLSEIENIVAIKDASGDLDRIAEIIERTSDDFLLYSGDDSLTLPIKALGGDGVISVASHVIGKEMKQMIELYNQGKVTEAAKLHRKLLPIMKGVFIAPSPSPVKAALNMKGVDVGGVRLPLVPLNSQEQEVLENALNSF
ncbi:4-hydroxy-tetrahydrodipicolinate synthase [Salinibacillus xinjiangensis]